MFLCFKKEEKNDTQVKNNHKLRRILWQHSFRCKMWDTEIPSGSNSLQHQGCLPQAQQLLCSVESQAQDVTLRKNFAFGLCFSSEQKRKKKKPLRVFSFPSCSAPPARPTTSVLPEVTLLARGALPPPSQWSRRLLGGDPVPAAAVFPISHQAFSNLWDLVFLQHSLWDLPSAVNKSSHWILIE